MSINKAEQLLENRLVKEVTEAKRDLTEIKGRQPVGGDIVVYEGIPTGSPSTVSFVISASSNTRVTITIIPASPLVVNWDLYFSFYVDTDANADYLWPLGASVFALRHAFKPKVWWDWGRSSDTTGHRVVHLDIENTDVSDHTLYLYFKVYGPKLAAGF